MFMFFAFLIAQAQPGGGGFAQMMPTLLMFGAVILVMYFLLIRPQQKRQKEHQRMLEGLRRGDKVITSAGIHGTITDIDEKTYEIQIADNTKVRFERASIAARK